MTDKVLNDRLDLFNAFSAILQRVAVELASNGVLQAACQSIVENMPSIDHSGILVMDSEAFESGTVVADYPSRGVVGERFILDPAVYTQMQTDQQPIMIEDIKHFDDPTHLDEKTRQLFIQQDIQSVLIIPLITQNKLVGTLGVDAIGHRYRFTEDEISVLSSLGGHIATSIRNAQLYEAAQQRTREQEQVQLLLQRLPLRSDLSTLLKISAEEIGKILGATEARIHIISSGDTTKDTSGEKF